MRFVLIQSMLMKILKWNRQIYFKFFRYVVMVILLFSANVLGLGAEYGWRKNMILIRIFFLLKILIHFGSHLPLKNRVWIHQNCWKCSRL